MSGSAATLPAGVPNASAALGERSSARRLPWALGACVALAGLSLLAPSQPTYDPWSWILWGREITHLDLSTSFGPSWKPLPVALTTVFSLFGSAAPALWVLAARAGALAGALFAYRLGRRLAGPYAGAVAAIALLVAPWFARNAALANSEGLQVAFALAAVERAFVGRHRQAWVAAIGLGLLRPEAWPVLGFYGLWLAWRRRERLTAIALGLASLPILWLVPEQIGSGDWLRAAHRAQQPVSGTAADAPSPVVEVLREGWNMLGGPVHWALVVALVAAAWRRDRRLLALAGLIAAWAGLVGVMSATGYSGNTRYLVVPAALAIVVAVAGLARAAAALSRPRGLPSWLAPLAALAALAGIAGPWIGPTHRALDAASYQARMTDELHRVVARAGGPARVLSCGPVATGAYLVPAVAWELGRHIGQIRLVAEDPGTVLRVHTTGRSSALPTLNPLAGRPVATLAFTPSWRVVTTCGAGR